MLQSSSHVYCLPGWMGEGVSEMLLLVGLGAAPLELDVLMFAVLDEVPAVEVKVWKRFLK